MASRPSIPMRPNSGASRVPKRYSRIPTIALASVMLLVVLMVCALDLRDGVIPRSSRLTVRGDIETILKTMDDFDISAGPLPTQLTELLGERQVTYVYVFRDLNGIQGNAVHGRLACHPLCGRIRSASGLGSPQV